VELPDELVRRVSGTFGDAGRDWLPRLPEILRELAERWELELGEPFADLSYHYVVRAQRAGEALVLKVGVPNPEMPHEVHALEVFSGGDTVRLHASDVELGAQLLEQVSPGGDLWQLDEDEAVRVAGAIMRRLPRPAPDDGHRFPTLEDWAGAFDRYDARFPDGGPLPAPRVERARALFRELPKAGGPAMLLHGDLHHANVLRAERQPWLVIDPKGVVGDPAFEAACFLRNAFERSADPRATLEGGAAVLSEALEVERDHILRWTLAHALLSAAWSVEDDQSGYERDLACAELAESLL
jgi:streptomycin 6-kinase